MSCSMKAEYDKQHDIARRAILERLLEKLRK